MTITQEIVKACIKYNMGVEELICLHAHINLWEVRTLLGSSSLVTKGFIKDGRCTELGLQTYKNITSATNDEFEKLYNEIKQCMLRTTGKNNIKGFGNVYFMVTLVELKQFLTRFWKTYPDYKDMDKISKIICSHIKDCHKKGSFAPAIKYFIIKEVQKGAATSQLASGYENYDDEKLETTNTKTSFEL